MEDLNTRHLGFFFFSLWLLHWIPIFSFPVRVRTVVSYNCEVIFVINLQIFSSNVIGFLAQLMAIFFNQKEVSNF